MECKCAKNTWNLHARGCHNYLAPIGIPIMVDESRLREQIAREIEAKICYDFHCEPDEQEVCNVMRLSLLDAAAIARGGHDPQ